MNPDEFAQKIELDENPWEVEQIVEEIKKVKAQEA